MANHHFSASFAQLFLLLSFAAPLQNGYAATATTEKVPYINEQEFQTAVLKSKQPVLLDFTGDWCAPCKAMAPAVEKLAEKYAGKMKFYRMDIDDNEDLADDLKVEAVPTFILFDGNCIVKQDHGNIGATKLEQYVTEVLNRVQQKVEASHTQPL